MAETATKILSGKAAAAHVADRLRAQIAALGASGAALTLATVQIGDSADIRLYSQTLGKALARYGVRHQENVYPAATEQKKLVDNLQKLYADPNVTGVLIFSPIPAQIDWRPIFYSLPLKKDVEGRSFLKHNALGILSPTANAVMTLLRHLRKSDPAFTLTGKHAVLVGHSDLVGKPTAMLLSDEGCTVTVCHKDTRQIEKHVADADILVVAIGRPGVIRAEWIKPGCVVIDVGENVVDGHVVGDVDFEAALERAAYVTPVPGGVGPLTNLMVIQNLIKLHELKGSLGVSPA